MKIFRHFARAGNRRVRDRKSSSGPMVHPNQRNSAEYESPMQRCAGPSRPAIVEWNRAQWAKARGHLVA